MRGEGEITFRELLRALEAQRGYDSQLRITLLDRRRIFLSVTGLQLVAATLTATVVAD